MSMNTQFNWQHMIAILSWQALMLTVLIGAGLLLRTDADAAQAGHDPAVLTSAHCDEPDSSQARKARQGGGRLFDISLGI